MWSAITAWCDRYGNVASVIGLILTVVGFCVTFWNFRRVNRVIQDTIERISVRLLERDVADALRLVKEAKQACNDSNWPHAAVRCEDARECLARYSHHRRVSPDERERIQDAVGHLRLIAQYVGRIGSAENQPRDLSRDKRRQLDLIIELLNSMQGRLWGAAMEPWNG
jgi:hypothetical protein